MVKTLLGQGWSVIRSFLTLLWVAFFALSACTSGSNPSSTQRISVVATTTIVGDVVSQVAGELVQLAVLLPAGSDPHAFEPRPRDIALIADADLIFASGAGLETFLEPLIENSGGSARIIEVSQGIHLLEFKSLNSKDATGESHPGLDPHVWQNPQNVIIWVKNIDQALSQADPQNTETYHANASAYIEKLQKLDQDIQGLLAVIPEDRRLLVTDHDTFGYFADHYGFTIVESVVPGFSTLSSPSAQEISALEDQIRELTIKAIFVGNTVSPALSEQIAQDTGAQVYTVYTDSLSSADKPAATYLQFMEYNAQTIANALK